MNLPWRGGLLIALLLAQDPAPPRPDLVAKYAAILDKGPDARRDLAARALLSLGRPGYEALKRAIAAKPELAKGVVAPGDEPPALTLVRIPALGTEEKSAQAAVNPPDGISGAEHVIPGLGTVMEPYLWESLDSADVSQSNRAARYLRQLYGPPPDAPKGTPKNRLGDFLDVRRDFDLTDRSLASFLADESFSWILMSPRDEKLTIRLKGVTLREFFRIATPQLAAVAVGDLLVLVPPDRVAALDPPHAVWAPSELAPRLEAALVALARGEEGPINGLTGVGVYHALRRAARSGGEKFSTRAEDLRKQLEQRIFFIGAPEDDLVSNLKLSPTGTSARETVAAFEKAAGLKLDLLASTKLDGSPPAFRFHGITARLAARALAFRLNHIY